MLSLRILRQRWQRKAVEGLARSSSFFPHMVCKILANNTHLLWEGGRGWGVHLGSTLLEFYGQNLDRPCFLSEILLITVTIYKKLQSVLFKKLKYLIFHEIPHKTARSCNAGKTPTRFSFFLKKRIWLLYTKIC